MNQAMQLEGYHGLKPERVNSHLSYFYKILNPEFVSTFMDIFADTRKLRTFVYAIDALAELSRSKGFPSGRLLNNPDIYTKPNRAAFMFTNLARMTRDSSVYGVAIPQALEEIITEEIFKFDYLQLFGEFFNATRLPYIVCILDNVQYHISLVRNFRTVPGYSAIKFIDGVNRNEVFLPFHTTRLGSTPEE